MQVKFKDWLCDLQVTRFVDGNGRALLLTDSESGEIVARANVNIDGLAEGELAIKNYSENEGMLEALVAAGVVVDAGIAVNSGFVVLPIVRLVADLTEAA